MATFKELISPIVKENKKEELLEIVNDANRVIEGIGNEKMMTENGTAIVGIASRAPKNKACVRSILAL